MKSSFVTTEGLADQNRQFWENTTPVVNFALVKNDAASLY